MEFGIPLIIMTSGQKSERLKVWLEGSINQTLYNQTVGRIGGGYGCDKPFLPKIHPMDSLQHDNKDDDPEIPELTVLATTFYTQSLGVPDHVGKMMET